MIYLMFPSGGSTHDGTVGFLTENYTVVLPFEVGRLVNEGQLA